jgi:hypothetical protein
MRHAGVVKAIKRPKSTVGRRLDWLRPDDAFKLLEAASATDNRLGALMTFLLYAGPRLSEALRLIWADVDLNAATTLLRQTKNGEPIMVHLPPSAVRYRCARESRQGQAASLWSDQMRAALCAARQGREAVWRHPTGRQGVSHAAPFPRDVEAPIRRCRHCRLGRIGPMEVPQRRQRLRALAPVDRIEEVRSVSDVDTRERRAIGDGCS